jgi:hypothetical protein
MPLNRAEDRTGARRLRRFTVQATRYETRMMPVEVKLSLFRVNRAE